MLRPPFDRASGAVEFDFKRSSVVRRRNTTYTRVPVKLGGVVDCIEAFDNLLAIDGLDNAQLSNTGADQLDIGDQRMPVASELSDQLPNLVRRGVEVDAFRHMLQFQIRRGEVRKSLGARFGGLRCTSSERFTVAIHQPREKDIDDIGIDRSSTASLISPAIKCAFLDF